MKIAFLSRYQNRVDRGAESFVTELATRLKKNHDVVILAGKDADSLTQVVKGNYDIVFPMNGRLQALKASIGRLFGGYKLVITGQSGIGKDDIFNVAICRPDLFVPITHFAAQMSKSEQKLPFWQRFHHKLRKASTWNWGTKLHVIHNGVDVQKFTPVGLKIIFDLPKPIILSVGALEWYKHHERTIEAVAKLKKGSLVIVGKGSQKEALTKLAEEKLKGRFTITAFSYEQLPQVYRSADVFTLPSWEREAFGIVYIEALASNLPVVAPDDLPRREIIEDAGVFVDVSDSTLFSQALEKAIEQKWGTIPRDQAKKFSWDKIAMEYEKELEEIL